MTSTKKEISFANLLSCNRIIPFSTSSWLIGRTWLFANCFAKQNFLSAFSPSRERSLSCFDSCWQMSVGRKKDERNQAGHSLKPLVCQLFKNNNLVFRDSAIKGNERVRKRRHFCKESFSVNISVVHVQCWRSWTKKCDKYCSHGMKQNCHLIKFLLKGKKIWINFFFDSFVTLKDENIVPQECRFQLYLWAGLSEATEFWVWN